MNIYAAPGTKVIFNKPQNGYDCDQEKAMQYLEVDKEYTVGSTNVHSWCSEVYLKEFPGISFNTVLFS